MASVICKTCGNLIENDDATLIWHLVTLHGITQPRGFDSWNEAQFLRRAMGRLMEIYFEKPRFDGDDGTAGVREPRRPNPPRPSVAAFADSESP